MSKYLKLFINSNERDFLKKTKKGETLSGTFIDQKNINFSQSVTNFFFFWKKISFFNKFHNNFNKRKTFHWEAGVFNYLPIY